MKKFLLLIIGILPLLLFSPTARAQMPLSGTDDSFCGDTVPISDWSIYRKAYCQAGVTENDEIYEILASQFGTDDAEVIEKIINFQEVEADEWPAALKRRYSFATVPPQRALGQLTLDVRAAYEKEKIIQRMKKSFKSGFEVSEKWYNASLFDSPFDLVTDLNLIDVMLFGSQATWNNDVYRWPGDEDEESSGGQANGHGEGSPVQSSDGRQPRSDTTGQSPQTESPFNPNTDCVPPDSPDALPPSPGEIPPACGNGRLDPAEECDDGNNQSGDGCGNNCQLEDLSSIMCRDAEAVTFRDYRQIQNQPAGGGASAGWQTSGSSSGSQNQCPPGTRPRQTPRSSDQTASAATSASSSSNYPGPFLGGVLANIPQVNVSPCPEGQSEWSVTVLGDTNSVCLSIPEERCADFDTARDYLLGPNWQDDEDKVKIALSIEALFCVRVSSANRPETPYSLNEGCIDCQIRGMNDELQELLEYTISPMENPRNAFGISNRWGPSFSLDLNTAIKAMPSLSLGQKEDLFTKSNEDEKKRKQHKFNQLDPEGNIKQPSILRDEDESALLRQYQAFNANQEKSYFEELKAYRINTSSKKESEFSGRVGKLLEQWRQSFSNIQNDFMGMATQLKFNLTRRCE